jgi:hypothetical protein
MHLLLPYNGWLNRKNPYHFYIKNDHEKSEFVCFEALENY